MELTNEFTVDVPVARAWAVLTDLERIAPCLPGAELREVEGDRYRGVVKIKVGPIATAYEGTARFSALDEGAGRIVLRAEGRETRGQGNANANVTATLTPSGEGTHVTVVTDLAITGKVAQFGRGVLADVSAKLLAQFVANLESSVLSGEEPIDTDPSPDGASGEEPTVRHIDSPTAEPLDVVGLAGGSVLRRALPIAAIVGVLVVVVVWLARRR